MLLLEIEELGGLLADIRLSLKLINNLLGDADNGVIDDFEPFLPSLDIDLELFNFLLAQLDEFPLPLLTLRFIKNIVVFES